MKIGMLTTSRYMYDPRFSHRIFAPGPLSRSLVNGLKKRGHDITWFSAPEKSDIPIIPGDQELLDKDLLIREFQDIIDRKTLSFFASKMYYEVDLLTRAYAYGKEHGIEVMHNFHSWGFLAHFFEELIGIPTLHTLHDPIPDDDMLERWILDRFAKDQRFISISDSQRGRFKDKFYATVYNGLEIEKYPFSKEKGSYLVTVGRMMPEKGHAVAISAACLANERLMLVTWLNDIVKKTSYFSNQVEPFVDGKQISIIETHKEDMASIYQGAKALFFPLQWEEPFGMVMIEAMACGTPVIAYNRGSVSEIVKDGVTGFIIDPDDTDRPGKGSWVIKKQGVEGLVEAIGRLGELDRAQSRKHVEEKFTVEKMVEGYEAVYAKVLGR